MEREYWQGQFEKFPKIDPLLVKAIIAKESSFDPKADPKVSHSTAYGLMQIVNKSRKALSKSIKSSVSMEYVTVERKELADPVINIAVGIRWIIVKYFLIHRKKGNKRDNLIKSYYGHKDKKENEKYLQAVLKYYNTSVKSKRSGR
ncbi:MAG: transglycosylase SLT domain-containing protein [Halobacteriovoraceae bacterium]|nr:transglycosylase SLT domain-containing protein [Halobacteriovoraceae bacterium]